MRVVAIIQARTGSERLPGKVLMDISGKPLLQHIVERLRRSRKIDELVVATSTSEGDKKILDLADRLNVRSFAGSESDVLGRFWEASQVYRGDVIVRALGDNPLVDPESTDRNIEHLIENDLDYVISSGLPLGGGTEPMSYKALDRAHREGKAPHHREHVTSFIKEHPEIFKIAIIPSGLDGERFRLTVDTPEDLELVRAVYRELHKDGKIVEISDAIELLKGRPDLVSLNAHVKQKSCGCKHGKLNI
ncbi:MAG: cytidylyltransferase domain-containing protein [bacterium]